MIFLIFETGGIASPNLIWLAMGALLTIIFLDTRASLVSLVFDVFCIIGFRVLGSRYVVVIPLDLLDNVRVTISILSTIFLAFVGLFFESARQHTQNQLEVTLADLQLTNSKLHIANDEAQAATKAKSEFLANMSHEIRTPLNGIIGVTGLLFDTPLNSEQQEYSQIIQSSGNSLLTIINDVLDFSKIEAGKLELEKQPFDLRQCVEDVLDLVSSKSASKGLELSYRIDFHIPTLFVGDATRFRQILANLLGNAVKFTAKGEIVVYVGGTELDNGRFQLHVSVKDTGIGIPEERMNRLFQSFSQVDSSTTRKFGGTGLGLVISKRLAELMDGRLWAESEPGVGSTFHFTVLGTAVPGKRDNYLQTEQPVLANKHVLVLDDNATNRQILCHQVAAWGMSYVEANSAAAALELLKTGASFDIALVDMQMPEMNGVDLAHALQKQFPTRKMPLLLLTSLGQQDEAMKQAFTGILTKPVKPSRLHEMFLATFSEGYSARQREQTQGMSAFAPFSQSLRILLAEDNRINQKVGLRMLAKFGCRADVAANGLEVLDALVRQPYDIVLMDINMPEMDGVETTQLIIERYGEKRPYIIALTANALAGDREVYLESGMDDYLSKPIKLEALLHILQKAVKVMNAPKRMTLHVV
ncbi:MAG: response regulator [Ardenticatenaceae bacterium]|nr:response regulator [Ardenticatenaceae bacterium]